MNPCIDRSQAQPHLVLALALVLSACGDAPRPVEAPSSSPHAHGTFRGFAGQALLKGELALAERGALMISVYPKGTRMPALTTKIALDDPRVTRNARGERVVDFQLDESTSMIPGAVPDGLEVELEVRFDLDGYVETKEGDVSAMVPARPGDRGLVLVLPPETAPAGGTAAGEARGD